MRVGGGGIPLSNSTSLALVHITQAWRMEYFSFAVVQCGKWIKNFLAQLGCLSSVGIQATYALLLRQNGSPKRQGLGNRLGKSRREFSVCGKRGMDGRPKKRRTFWWGRNSSPQGPRKNGWLDEHAREESSFLFPFLHLTLLFFFLPSFRPAPLVAPSPNKGMIK